MKNLHDVLKQKESDIQRLQAEIEVLQLAAQLLADETDISAPEHNPIAAATGTYSAARENSLRQFP